MNNSNPFSMPPSPHRPLRAKLLLAMGALAFLGFVDAAYLAADHYIGLPLPCTVLKGCDVVMASPYSMVGPIPLALFGVLFYLMTLVLAVHLYTSAPSLRLEQLLAGFTAAGLVMSIIFESIQAFIIHALCEYCALSALITILLFVCGVMLFKQSRSTPVC